MDRDDQPFEVALVSPSIDDSGCILLLLYCILLGVMCISCQLRSHAPSYPVVVEAEPVVDKV